MTERRLSSAATRALKDKLGVMDTGPRRCPYPERWVGDFRVVLWPEGAVGMYHAGGFGRVESPAFMRRLGKALIAMADRAKRPAR